MKNKGVKRFTTAIVRMWNSITFKVILIAVIVFLLLLNAYGLSLFRGVPDYEKFGTVGEWFTVFTTILTIAVAAITVINDKRIAENERKYNELIREQDKKEHDEDLSKANLVRSQAVFAWKSGIQDPITGSINEYQVYLLNKTGAPVFYWKVLSEHNSLIISSDSAGPIFPDDALKIETRDGQLGGDIVVAFESFDGKRWIRKGAEVQEVKNA